MANKQTSDNGLNTFTLHKFDQSESGTVERLEE